VELFVVKNSHLGTLRYPEVFIKTLITRIKHQPDIYILTFRGYEMLIPIRLITLGKKLVFDEFINLVEWVVYEHKKIPSGSLGEKILKSIYKFWIGTTSLILTDTVSHADLSAKMMHIPRKKYIPLIVSTDEEIFNGDGAVRQNSTTTFTVFYYGNMLPLHGVDVVLEAMRCLGNKHVELTLIGGDESTEELVKRAINSGANITYKSWVNFNELPRYMQEADVCLAGPFGDTFQSQYVITGKAYQFLQMKRPIIVGNNKESHLFTDKKNALIVEQGNPEALARAIEWAYKHKAELPAIGKAGFRLYQDKLSGRELARQMKGLLALL